MEALLFLLVALKVLPPASCPTSNFIEAKQQRATEYGVHPIPGKKEEEKKKTASIGVRVVYCSHAPINSSFIYTVHSVAGQHWLEKCKSPKRNGT